MEEAEQEPEVEAELARIRGEYAQLTPEDIRCIDPCQGSGHILVYMFDVLMQIYESYGYTTQEAVAGIVKNNIYGLDIDERAAQLSYFAVMMKACQYDKRFLKRKDEEGKPKVPQPRVYAIQESNDVDSFVMEYFCNGNAELKEAMETIMEEMYDAKEYGSIITVTEQNWDVIYARFEEIREDISIHKEGALELLPLVQVAQALAQKYDVVVTNPPYMGGTGMSSKLSAYVKAEFPNSKNDLFAVFIENCRKMIKELGYQAMITQQSWMFLSGYERLRDNLHEVDTVNLVHLGAHAFEEIGGEVVQTVSFVLQKTFTRGRKGVYVRLVRQGNQNTKERAFIASESRYEISSDLFMAVPGKRIVYWFGSASLWEYSKISDNFISGGRNKTHNNERYVREWWEIIPLDKWVFYMNGGNCRKWYGNLQEVVNWTETAKKEYASHGGLVDAKSVNSYGISWNGICGELYGFRLKPIGIPFSSSSPTIVNLSDKVPWSTLAFLNTKVCHTILSALNPTLQLNVGEVLDTPLELPEQCETIKTISRQCVEEAMNDWDSFETSWDFKCHPIVQAYFDNIRYQENGLLQGRNPHLLKDCYIQWGTDCNLRFETLKRNEEELNRIFIDIYGLQDELTPEVEDKDITIRKADLQRDIKSLISYAVGCMFGRYSLDKEGLIFAGGCMEDKFSYYGGTVADTQDYPLDGKYTWGELGSKFYYIPIEGKKALECWKVDADNIIPVTDDEYFEDDIVGKFTAFIRMVYGENTLEENLKFIAEALGGKGQPREVIRNYFLNEFYKDHCRIYQKRPIYWLFDSGKKNGFKCLIYMHRYESDTIARIRTDYVHEQQSRYRTAIADLENRIGNAGASERVKLNKSLKKIQEQADELHAYEEKIHHLADQMIAIDLDDGVKQNYEIFKDVLAKIK